MFQSLLQARLGTTLLFASRALHCRFTSQEMIQLKQSYTGGVTIPCAFVECPDGNNSALTNEMQQHLKLYLTVCNSHGSHVSLNFTIATAVQMSEPQQLEIIVYLFQRSV